VHFVQAVPSAWSNIRYVSTTTCIAVSDAICPYSGIYHSLHAMCNFTVYRYNHNILAMRWTRCCFFWSSIIFRSLEIQIHSVVLLKSKSSFCHRSFWKSHTAAGGIFRFFVFAVYHRVPVRSEITTDNKSQ